MSAQQYPPSDRLLKLKLLLEKANGDLARENPELVSWMSDRNLHIDQLSYTDEQKSDVLVPTDTVEQILVETISVTKTHNEELADTISHEEFESVIQKMIQLLELPAGQLEEQSELYLEQQLSDILGFEVSNQLDGNRILYTTGIMEARPHLKRTPTDSLEKHSNYKEAGISQNRSAFGWFSQQQELDAQTTAMEKYYFSLPLYHLPDWNIQYQTLKPWFKHRKMVMINPQEKLAVVGVVGAIGPNTPARKQFGGSPEVIREGKVWSPLSQGRVLMLFVDDDSDQVPLGVYQLTDKK